MRWPPPLPRKLQLLLVAASFAWGAYRVVNDDYSGVLWLLASAYGGQLYFRYDAVRDAFREVANGRYARAAQVLQGVESARLSPASRAYFELGWAMICAARAENARAEAHAREALRQALQTENDRAMAETLLAQLLMARGANDEARAVVARAADRPCRPALAERIRALHAELAGPHDEPRPT